MTLSTKLFIAAIFCCTIAFSHADSNEAQDQAEWKTFLLSNTIDPETNPNNPTWTTQDWLEFLNQRDALNRKLCPECDSLLKNDLNTIIVATEAEIRDAFSQNNKDSEKSEQVWSSRSFQTYMVLNGSVFDCGFKYVYAEVNDGGLPTDLLSLSNDVKQHSKDLNVTINCLKIEDSKSDNTINEAEELVGEDYNLQENVGPVRVKRQIRIPGRRPPTYRKPVIVKPVYHRKPNRRPKTRKIRSAEIAPRPCQVGECNYMKPKLPPIKLPKIPHVKIPKIPKFRG